MGKKGIRIRQFTKQEDDFIRANYLTMNVNAMSRELGRADSVAGQRMRLLGIIVPPEIIAQRKAESRFKKGQTPPNKGKKWKEFMTKKGQARSRTTTFRKGHLPHNTRSNGEISIRKDKRGIEYKHIRVKLGVWVPLQRYVWEKSNGKIKRGRKIIFKDGNPMNCKINNLECLTARELMLKNSYHTNYPKELALVIQLRGALTRQINKHEKRQNEK